MSDLLPCPFCGSEAEILTAKSMRGEDLYGVMCNCCTARTDVFDSEDGAIDSWNSRYQFAINDEVWREGSEVMTDKKPCPFCGDDSDYSRFLELCAERANEMWRENEVRILVDLYKSMDFVQVVRCRDCKFLYWLCGDSYVCNRNEKFMPWVELDCFCSWGQKSKEE